MTYNASNLSALTSANGFTLWHYRTPDSASDVADTDYFDEAIALLQVGDIIYLHANMDGDAQITQLAVTYNRDGLIDCALLTPIVGGRPSE